MSQPTVEHATSRESIWLPVDDDDGKHSSERNEHWCREFREVRPGEITLTKDEFRLAWFAACSQYRHDFPGLDDVIGQLFPEGTEVTK